MPKSMGSATRAPIASASVYAQYRLGDSARTRYSVSTTANEAVSAALRVAKAVFRAMLSLVTLSSGAGGWPAAGSFALVSSTPATWIESSAMRRAAHSRPARCGRSSFREQAGPSGRHRLAHARRGAVHRGVDRLDPRADHSAWHLLISENGPEGSELGRRLRQYVADERIEYSPTGADLGAATNHTRLIQHGSAPYVAILHDDDRWDPEFLERRVQFLEATPTVASSSRRTARWTTGRARPGAPSKCSSKGSTHRRSSCRCSCATT